MTPSSSPPLSKRLEASLGGIALLLLLVGCVFVLRPFFTALMWAMILAYALYPLQLRFTRWFRGARTLAACLVTLTLTVVLAGPIVLIGFSLAEDGVALAKATRTWFMEAPDEAPAWMQSVPLVGDEMTTYWRGIAEDRDRWLEQLDKAIEEDPPKARIVDEAEIEEAPVVAVAEEAESPDPEEVPEKPNSSYLVKLLGQFLALARTWLIAIGLAVGQGVTQILLSAFLAFFLLRDAPILAERLNVAMDRLAGERGQRLLKVAGDTVHGVIYGVLGTALAQAVVAGVGFKIAGVPGAVFLGTLTFFFSIIPFGPPVIWVPATLWLFAQGEVGWGFFMLVWGTFGISGVDNILRPFLISQNSKMPFVLIFCGVVGGALSLGLVGVFIGPTLLSVAYRLIDEWSLKPSLETKTISELPEGEGSVRPAHGSGSIGAG